MNAVTLEATCDRFSPSDHDKRIVVPQNGFDAEEFYQVVRSKLADRYMGYAFLLQDRQGERIVVGERGYARTPCEADGAQPFTIRTKTAWGSVSKMVTFTAAMHRIEQAQSEPPGLTDGPPTPKPSLDAPMQAFLPKQWREQLHQGFIEPVTVTIRHLLEHRAGFKKTAPGTIWERLFSGPETEQGVGPRKYSNTSASLFQSMPFFLNGSQAQAVELECDGLSDAEYNKELDFNSKLIYQNYVQKHIWQPLDIRAKCNDTNFPQKNYAMFYESTAQKTGKKVTPDPDNPKCAPGGWVLSPLAMGRFVHALTGTNLIISQEAYAQMVNIEQPEHRLGWASSHQFSDGRGFSHNGSRWKGKAKGQMMVFPNGFTAVGAANSKPPEDCQCSLKEAFREAYEAAIN